MNKEEAIQYLLRKIYTSDSHLQVTHSQVSSIEKGFKDCIKKYSNVQEMIADNPKTGELIQKMPTGMEVLDAQLRIKKALQRGMLDECSMIQTLARILGLRHYLNLKTTNIADTPYQFLQRIIDEDIVNVGSPRFVYFNQADESTVLLQYGSPTTGDGVAALYSNNIQLEIKVMPALILDKDLLYDEDGKLLVTKEIRNNYPVYLKYIDRFNTESSIMEYMGSNYKLFNGEASMEERMDVLQNFFTQSSADVLLTIVDDQLIAIKKEDMCYAFPDGNPLISTSGSEIRTTGKNNRTKPFTPKYCEDILRKCDVVYVDSNTCRVYNTNDKIMGRKVGRMHAEETRFKLSHAFYVKIADVTFTDEYAEFPRNKIRQSKAGISVHVSIKHSKENIGANLYPDLCS